METAYDWITIAAFAALAVLFLQRSAGPRPPGDRMPHYLVAAVCCAGVNWLGNHGYDLPAIALGIAGVAYVFYFLRPFTRAE